MLDSRSAYAQAAADEPFGLWVECLIFGFGHDDPLLQVHEAVGGVVILLLRDLTLIARDARECQERSPGKQGILYRTWLGAAHCRTSRAPRGTPLWPRVGVVVSRLWCAATDKAPVQAGGRD